MTRTVDIVVVGGGSAGCVLASRLSEDPYVQVMLIEAGPDYGPYESHRWPADLLNASFDATDNHDWGFVGETWSPRARVIGGCSAHNGCAVVWPSPDDIDDWAAAGNVGWTYENLRPSLLLAQERMRTRPTELGGLDPFRRAFYAAATQAGLPELSDFNAPDSIDGIGLIPVNAIGDLRWNAAFAYLDSARGRPNFNLMANALVDRVLFADGAARGVRIVRLGEQLEIAARTVLLAAGAYASPAILQRSGVGPADLLRDLDIECVADRPGVGARLANHTFGVVTLEPNNAFRAAARTHLAQQADTGHTMIKARLPESSRRGWDMMIGPSTSPEMNLEGRATSISSIGLIGVISKPLSSGNVAITSRDPEILPYVQHGFLSDAPGHDRHVLKQSLELAKQLAQTSALQEWLAAKPIRDSDFTALSCIQSHASLGEAHPASSCRMGPDDDPGAVVDATGRVYGLLGLYVIDASILPTIPAANIHLTVLAVAERLAAQMMSVSIRGRGVHSSG